MAERSDKQLDRGTPAGRKPLSRLGVSSSKKARAPFKSPYGKELAPKEKPPQEDPSSLSVNSEILDKLEAQKKLDAEINQLRKQGLRVEELNEHISKLHEYNEIKDIGQMLLGQIAMKQGVTTKDLYERFGLELDD